MPVVQPSSSGYDGPEIPDGLYVVTCTKIEETILEQDKFGKTDKFRLTLTGGFTDGTTFIVEPLLNQSWSEKSNLFLYAVAFGLDPNPNEAFDTDALIGKKAQALVVTAEEAGSWPRVQTITGIKGKASASSGRAAEASKDDGKPDYIGFWAQVKVMGKTQQDVIALLPNKDLLDMSDLTGHDLVMLLEQLSV